MMRSAPPSRNPVNARIQRLESRAAAAELVAAVRDDFLAYDRKPANTSRHYWMWPVPPLAKDMPINCLLEHLLYLGTRLSSRDGPKVSIGHQVDRHERRLTGTPTHAIGLPESGHWPPTLYAAKPTVTWALQTFSLERQVQELIAVSQFAEMPHPNRPFRYDLEGQQCGVDFIKLSNRVRPGADVQNGSHLKLQVGPPFGGNPYHQKATSSLLGFLEVGPNGINNGLRIQLFSKPDLHPDSFFA